MAIEVVGQNLLDAVKPWVGLIITDKLQKLEPTFNIDASDRDKVANMCRADFWEYATWLQKTFPKLDDSYDAEVDLPDNTQTVEIIASDYGMFVGLSSTQQIVDFVESFVSRWWKKYKERVKLLLNPPKLDKFALEGIQKIPEIFTAKEQEEILNEITNQLIRWGEICMPRKMADTLFKRTVGQFVKKDWKVEDKINIMNNLVREARRVAYTHGHLVFITPSKDYYLREYRDSGATPPQDL